jgi:hypothetical protein
MAAGQRRFLNRIAFYQNRRDEIPNQELAKELAETGTSEGVREIAEGLSNGDPAVRSDCLKVLYDNRLVWGAMIALSTIAPLRSAVLGTRAEEIISVMRKGSVISVDNGVKVLAIVASKEPGLRKKLLQFLLDHLENCRAKDVPQHAEKILSGVDEANKTRFIKVLEARMGELTRAHASRVNKVIAAATLSPP